MLTVQIQLRVRSPLCGYSGAHIVHDIAGLITCFNFNASVALRALKARVPAWRSALFGKSRHPQIARVPGGGP